MQGQQFSAILPNQQQNPVDSLAQMNQQRLEQQRYQQQLERQQQERSDMWLREAYNQLDFKHFATGTVLDPVISQSLQTAKQALAKRIMENPDLTSASIMYDVANVAGDVTQYSTKAKNVRAQVEAMTKEYAKNPSVDVGTLNKVALTKAFMKYDPNTHAFVPKDPSEIDDTEDYVTPALGSAINSDESLYERINKAPYNPYKKEWTVDRGGVRRQVAYEGKYSPVFHDLTDEKGNVVDGQNTPATGLTVRSTPVKIGDKTFQGVSDEAYRYFTTDPVTNAILERDAKAYVAQNPSLNIDDVKRVLLHGKLSNYTKGYINNTKNTVDDSQQQAHQWAVGMRYLGDALRANKVDDTAWNNAYKEIDWVASNNNRVENGKAAPVSHLSADTQAILIDYLNRIRKPSDNSTPNTQASVYVKKEKDGTIWMVDANTHEQIAPISKMGVNLKANTGQKPRAAVIKDAQQGSTQPKTQSIAERMRAAKK